jgi:hypothetical protein
VGFVCPVADRAGPSPLFTRSESPSAPRGTEVGVGSPDVFRGQIRTKTWNRGRDWAELRRPDGKNVDRGPRREDEWGCSKPDGR